MPFFVSGFMEAVWGRSMGGLLFLLAIVFLGVGGAQYWSACNQLAPLIPEEFMDRATYGTAIDILIWDAPVPMSARRQYVRSTMFFTIAFALIAGAIQTYGNSVPAMLFAGVTLVFAVWALRCWVRYRKTLLRAGVKADQ